MNLVILILALLVLAAAIPLVLRMRTRRAMAGRIRLEDALKHLLDCEYRDVTASVESIAGALGCSTDQAATIVGDLTARGLAAAPDRRCVLTGEGRTYALRMVRRHRILERFFADETLMRDSEWHGRAERDEHHYSDADIETMAARLGHPRWDPHGDPIPSATGRLPAARGRVLEQLAPGHSARILHIEDEPPSVYACLVEAGIAAGDTIELVAREATALRVRVAGREHRFSSLIASAITIDDDDAPASPDTDVPDTARPLSSLADGASARIVRITAACRGQQRRRLMDLGVLPGTRITAELRSPGGEPVAYRVRDALIALRRRHADMILVEPLDEGKALPS